MSPIFFDSKEVRSSDERENDHLVSLKNLIEKAKTITLHNDRLKHEISTLNDLQKIDVFRKSDLIEIQKKNLPFGNLNFKELKEFSHIYRSPGPIYDLDGYGNNWWRFARALNAAGFNNASSEKWPTHFIELEPDGNGGANIIWEWHIWDHLIQDIDPELPNYGVLGRFKQSSR